MNAEWKEEILLSYESGECLFNAIRKLSSKYMRAPINFHCREHGAEINIFPRAKMVPGARAQSVALKMAIWRPSFGFWEVGKDLIRFCGN